MSTDYMPKSFGNLKPWLTGLKTGVTTDGPTCGQSAGQLTTDTALIDRHPHPCVGCHDQGNHLVGSERHRSHHHPA